LNSIAPFRISICGLDELAGHCDTGVSHVLSILDPEWPVPQAFGRFGEHEKLELRFHDVIEDDPGMIVPAPRHVEALLAFGRDLLAEPPADAHLLVHCHAGVSRSTASMALLLAQARPDVPAARIFAEILRIRPQAWPNLRLLEMGDALLGRHGEMVAAVGPVYHTQLANGRHLAEDMRAGGRGREVDAAREPALSGARDGG
jgi:predicted protein tyrosine phosphatase